MKIYLLLMLFYFDISNFVFAQTQLLFCYEDKSLPPYFLGEGSIVPDNQPGSTIELMRKIDSQFQNLTIKYVRKPWKRCLDDLSKSNIDAVIGSYHIEREKIGIYPTVKGEIDPSKALSKHAVCFIKKKNSLFSWDGKNIQSSNKLVVGVSAGYMIIKVLEKLPVIIHETISADQALLLLENNRIDAAITLCQINKYKSIANADLKTQFSLVYPPLLIKSGYLIVSHRYYKNHSALVEKIWKYLIKLDSNIIYNKYVQ